MTLSGQVTSFSINLLVNKSQLSMSRYLSLEHSFWKGFVVHGGKRKITKVIFLCKNGSKLWRHIHLNFYCLVLQNTEIRCLLFNFLALSFTRIFNGAFFTAAVLCHLGAVKVFSFIIIAQIIHFLVLWDHWVHSVSV